MTCIFCNHDKINKEAIENSDNFLLLPALGSFIPNYFLIVSKQHTDSFGSMLSSDEIIDEFQEMKSKVEKFISEQTGKDCICFEHGGSSSNTSGCCIGHAHFHILPAISKNLKKTIEEKLGSPEIIKYQDIHKKEDSGYLLFEEKNKTFYWPNPKIISQFMRRIIAKELGLESKFDWKEFHFSENMQATTKNWQDKFSI